MNTYLKLIFIAGFLLSKGIAFSQQPKFNLALDFNADNLGYVNSITQDQKGYLWLASYNKGLIRYDGKKLVTFSHNSDNQNSLANNTVLSVCVDSTGKIWVGTIGAGLDCYNPETKKFTHFRRNPKDPASLSGDTILVVTTDRSGNIWLGTTRALDQFDPKTGKFKHFIIDELLNFKGNDFETPGISAIYVDRKNNVWIGWGNPYSGKAEGIGGLARLDQENGKFISYKHKATDPNSLANNNVSCIFEDRKNQLWVGSKGNGLQILDRTTGKFTSFSYNPGHLEKLSRPPFLGSPSDYTSFVAEDSKGRLWIGSSSGGINMFDPKLNRTNHFGLVSNDKKGQFSNDTLTGFKDSTAIGAFTSKEGLLWIVSGNKGIYNLDFSKTTVPYVPLNASASAFYFEEEKKVLWIKSDSGIIRKNLLNNGQKLFRPDSKNPGNPINLDFFDLKGDDDGNIWIASHNHGLWKFNLQSEHFTNVRHDKNNPGSLVHDTTHVLFFDRQHYLWIGTHKGLSRMDTKTGICTNYIHNPKDTSGLGIYHINGLAQDKNDQIWIGTDMDIYSLDVKTGKFRRFENKSGQVINLCVDHKGMVWATFGTELFWLDKQKNIFKKFSTLSFPGGFTEVSGIVEDASGNIWLSTNKTLVKISKERDVVKIFGAAQGVQPTSNVWLRNYRTMDGRLFLGGSKGFHSFKPEELIDERVAPLLNFSSFTIGNEEILPGEESVLAEPIWKANHLKISYLQNTISFEFGAIDLRGQGDIKYLYKLENYDNEWRDIGGETKATFFNLPHGDFVLQVKAVNYDGSVTQKSIGFTITPPWWQTWWAFGLYAILVIITGYLIYKYQKYYILKMERERAQQKELAQAKEIEKAYTELKATQAQLIQSEKMASLGELTAGIAHEIQNPLNFINNFSELNSELIAEMKEEIEKGNLEEVKTLANDLDENERKILHHGKRADAIVKGMLLHSRNSSGKKEPTDINALCDEYLRLAYHGLRAKDKSFNAKMETDFDETIGKINVIPQDIGRVILNLITNAFYVVDEKKKSGLINYDPMISLSTTKKGDQVIISVNDNGNGIPENVREKIFQPFFTTKPTGQGTGLGLSMSYDIMKVHGGDLTVETKDGIGTTFFVTLPSQIND